MPPSTATICSPGDARLDRLDAVERDARRWPPAPARARARATSAAPSSACAAATTPVTHSSGDEHVVAGQVRDAEPAAEVVDLEVADPRERGDGAAVGVERAQLRADVHVQPGDVDPVGERARGVRRHAELRAGLAGEDVLVRVGVDAGHDADEQARPAAERLQPVGVVLVVDHHGADAAPRAPSPARPRTSRCRAGRAARARSRRAGRGAARRRRRRRSPGPPRRRRAGPPCTGRPWRRRRPRRVRRGRGASASVNVRAPARRSSSATT